MAQRMGPPCQRRGQGFDPPAREDATGHGATKPAAAEPEAHAP